MAHTCTHSMHWRVKKYFPATDAFWSTPRCQRIIFTPKISSHRSVLKFSSVPCQSDPGKALLRAVVQSSSRKSNAWHVFRVMKANYIYTDQSLPETSIAWNIWPQTVRPQAGIYSVLCCAQIATHKNRRYPNCIHDGSILHKKRIIHWTPSVSMIIHIQYSVHRVAMLKQCKFMFNTQCTLWRCWIDDVVKSTQRTRCSDAETMIFHVQHMVHSMEMMNRW